MEISTYIGELLFEHDCVVIPNFGGFICNYRSADIHPVQNTISPPSKAISFNRNLQSNDGLLITYLAQRRGISFEAATNEVNGWVAASQSMLKGGNPLVLPKIGKLTTNIEGNIQFQPFNEVNYLKSSFGLRTIIAYPVTRIARQIDFTEKFITEIKQGNVQPKRRVWSIAASVLLVVSFMALAELMWMGVEVKQLHLNEAGVFGFMGRMFNHAEPEIAPLPVTIETAVETAPVTEPAAEATTITTPADNSTTYYIIIGAFKEDKNIEAARLQLQQRFPDSVILVEKTNRLTRLGYSVGHDEASALQQLDEARHSEPAYWLMKK
ncbi:MAG TPA: hypothetical protein PLW44_09175 [Chitinophagales bacterium]|nr:hypothetical protein [Chitinophagales bacterium]